MEVCSRQCICSESPPSGADLLLLLLLVVVDHDPLSSLTSLHCSHTNLLHHSVIALLGAVDFNTPESEVSSADIVL